MKTPLSLDLARRITATVLAAAATTLMLWPGIAGGVAHAAFTQDFRLEDCSWSSRGSQNPYFNLKPGYQLILEGEEDDEGEIILVRAEVTMLKQTERITFETPNGNTMSVKARVMEEREFQDGELVEVSRNWMARCRETSDIFYFGEDVDDYEDGEIVGHEGAWRSGVDGALPGIIMPGRYLLGAKYFQEVAPGVALDRGRHVGMGIQVPTAAGTFDDCVAVLDSTALDPDAEGDLKLYCPGVGIVMDEEIVLIEINHGVNR
ncbi:MAG: hypothetical protein OEM62_08880 [Acidobacteriota bacterium]|nr:hypothetical protein [Acidobacteriota bacterium]